MTTQRSFKRLVRARMDKTGESYTAARAMLLAAEDSKAERPALTMSDESIRRRTGRGWEEWFDLLDASGAIAWSHTEIARWVAEEQGADGWDAQSVAVSYERASGRRAVGEHADGYRASASRTVAVPVARLYDAFVQPSKRERWLPDAALRKRTGTKPKSARFDWGDDGTRLIVSFETKSNDKSTVTISHERLADADERDRMKAYWRERTAALKKELES